MKQALLTGASGFVGGELANTLVEAGYQVRALVRASSSTRHLQRPEIALVQGSLDNKSSLVAALKGVTHVFHIAGVVSAASEAEFQKHNSQGTENLAQAAADLTRRGQLELSKFVLLSSLAASGPSVPGSTRGESDRPEPVSAYGRSKLEAERRFLTFKNELPLVVVRPPIVYGPRDSQFFKIVKGVARGIAPELPRSTTSPEKYYSMVHVWDLCRGILLAAESASRSGEVFFVAGDEVVSDTEMFRTISTQLGVRTRKIRIPRSLLQTVAVASEWFGRLTGRAPQISRDKVREILPDAWTCTNAKAKQQLGFVPSYTFEQGMRETIDWYRSSGWLH